MRAENSKDPEVSWVIPAYNAGKFLEDALESIRNQTFEDWEAIISDDGSTDDTPEIIARYEKMDPRFRSIRRSQPSGGANQPRLAAIREARGKWIAPLDADDWVKEDYLASLISRKDRSGSDAVYPMMYDPESGSQLIAYPEELEEMTTVGSCKTMRGRDSVKYTLGGWRIACNGGLIRKEIYDRLEKEESYKLTYSCADELLTRALLWHVPSISFTDIKYLYRPNQDSITRKGSVNLFNLLLNNVALIDFCVERFGKDSEEYALAQKQNLDGVLDAFRTLNKMTPKKKDREEIKRRIRGCIEHFDKKTLSKVVKRRNILLASHPLIPSRLILRIYDSL